MAQAALIQDVRFEMLCQSDALIVKALNISEVAQIARIESNLREYFNAVWNRLKSQALKEAHSMALAGKSHSVISSRVIKIMNKWAPSIEKRLIADVEKIYKKSRIASWEKVRKESKAPLTYDMPNFTEEVKKALPKKFLHLAPSPIFDMADERAITATANQQVMWTKEHVGKNIAPSVRETVKNSLKAGKGRAETATLLRGNLEKELGRVRTPKGWNGSQRQYFEGIAANSATTARVQGHLKSFIGAGVKKYEIMNPRDERTCPVCSMMDGKVFSISQGVQVSQAEMTATSPEGVKSAHPWYGEKELKGITKGPGNQGPDDAAALTAAGYSAPPFHFRCRCTISVSEEAGSFDETGEQSPTLLGVKAAPTRSSILPRVPNGPRAKVDEKGFASRLKKADKLGVKGEKLPLPLQQQLRSDLNTLVAKENMVSQDILRKKKHADKFRIYKVGESGKASEVAAVNNWDGSLVAESEVVSGATDAMSGVKFANLANKREAVNNLKILIHETVHSHSTITRGAYSGIGVVIEEATTELAAVRVLKNRFPKLLKLRHLVEDRGYPEMIETLRMRTANAVKETLRVNPKVKKVWDKWKSKIEKKMFHSAEEEILTNASITIRQNTNPKFVIKTADEYKTYFAKSVKFPSEVTAGMSKIEVDKLHDTLEMLMKANLYY